MPIPCPDSSRHASPAGHHPRLTWCAGDRAAALPAAVAVGAAAAEAVVLRWGRCMLVALAQGMGIVAVRGGPALGDTHRPSTALSAVVAGAFALEAAFAPSWD